MTQLFKYFKSGMTDVVFQREGYICLKCDLPKNYNDPHELFFNFDFDPSDNPEHIAYFREILGIIPQLPTTCFSKNPDITPMWAHYGEDHKGFAIGFSEDAIGDSIQSGFIGDVSYSKENESMGISTIAHAYATGKPRHTFFVLSRAYKIAYFTKNECWEYEKERRLVVHPRDIVDKSGIMLLYLPINCISSIVVGAKCDHKTKDTLVKVSAKASIPLLELRIGKTSLRPYFISDEKTTYVYDDEEFSEPVKHCAECGEPVNVLIDDQCLWCGIGQDLSELAARKNPMRLLETAGIREIYGLSIAGTKLIGRQVKK